MNGADLLSLADGALRAAGEGEGEIIVRTTQRGFARFAMGELGQHMDLSESLAVVRVANGARVAQASTNQLEVGALVRALHAARAAADAVPELEGFRGFTGADEATGESPTRFAGSTAAATAESRAELLRPVLGSIADAGLISAGALETRVTSLALATTRGRRLRHDATAAHFRVWALETAGGGGAAGYGGQTHRDLSALDLATETARAIRVCTMSKGARSLAAGTYDVVMEPAAVTELVEWLATIAFSALEVEQGTSPIRGRLGEPITGEAITLIDDPLDEGPNGLATPFDREGVWRRRVQLIERGVARAVLHDRTTATRMGGTSTGSSLLTEGLGAGAVGASAVQLAGGAAESVDELIGGVERGLYVCRLHYVNGLLDPRRAVMTGLTRDGCFLIEKGKISHPVGNLRFTDSFLEGLARVDGMTRHCAAVPNFADAGVTVAPAIRMRAFRFNGASQPKGT